MAVKNSESKSVLPLSQILWSHHLETLELCFRSWVEQKKIPSVLLLTGPKGIGKREIVHFLAQWLQCDRSPIASTTSAVNPPESDLFGGVLDSTPDRTQTSCPCNACPNCRRALSGNAFDFLEIAPESEEDGRAGSIKIDAFRSLKASLGHGAHEGRYRIVFIRNAETMTPQAQNSILKLLEEPPAGWLFFLTAGDPTLLLPTLVSRCQRLRLKPFSVEEIERFLTSQDVPADRRRICSQLAQGSLEKSLIFAQDPYWEKRPAFFEFLNHPQTMLSHLVDWAAADLKNFEVLLDQLELIAADLIKWSLAISGDCTSHYNWTNEDSIVSLRAHAERISKKLGGNGMARDYWIHHTQQISDTRVKLLLPLNKKLLAQDLLAPWLEP